MVLAEAQAQTCRAVFLWLPCPLTLTLQCPFSLPPLPSWASLVAQRVKHLPAMWETRVRSLGREDPLEKEMAVHSSTLAWKIPWMEEPGGLHFLPHHTTISPSYYCHIHLSIAQIRAKKNSSLKVNKTKYNRKNSGTFSNELGKNCS